MPFATVVPFLLKWIPFQSILPIPQRKISNLIRSIGCEPFNRRGLRMRNYLDHLADIESYQKLLCLVENMIAQVDARLGKEKW